jgi:hypothetical protein
VRGHSKRIGVGGDLAAWTKAGVDAVELLKDRIMVVGLRNVASGGPGLNSFLVQLSRATEPESLVSPDHCTNCSRALVGLKPVFLRLEPHPVSNLAEVFTRNALFPSVVGVCTYA